MGGTEARDSARSTDISRPTASVGDDVTPRGPRLSVAVSTGRCRRHDKKLSYRRETARQLRMSI